MRMSLTLVISTLALTAPAGAIAQAFPTRPITVVVPYTAGGPVDILARLVAEKMSTEFKQTVIIENKTGGGGNIGAAHVAKAHADGYTILCSTDTPMTVNPALYRNMGFDPSKDLIPLSLATTFAQMLVVSPKLPVSNLAQFLALAKSEPLTFATGGNGSPGHLTGAYFSRQAGIELTHIPYKGNSQAVSDLLGGQVDAGFLATPGVLPHIKAGKLKGLAVTSTSRSPLAPTIPTASEGGVPGFEATFAMVYMAPTGTPADIVEKLQSAINRALAAPDVKERLAALDISAVGKSPSEAASYLDHYRRLWTDLAKSLKLQVD